MKTVNNTWSRHAEVSLKRQTAYCEGSRLQRTFHNLPRIWSWTGTTSLHLVKLVWRVWSWNSEAVWNEMEEIEKKKTKKTAIKPLNWTESYSKDLWMGSPDYPPACSAGYCFVFLLLPYVALDRPTRRFSVCFTMLILLWLVYSVCVTLFILLCLLSSEHCFFCKLL